MSALDPPRIGYAAAGCQLYILFDSGATHRVSQTAEQLVGEFLASNPREPTAILDLDGCPWVDSTFAGWMIRVQQRIAQLDGRVIVSNAGKSCRSALGAMGLAPLFEFRSMSAPPDLKRVACAEEGVDARTVEFMLDAHQRLADISPDNQRVFAHIAEQLRQELRHRTT